MAIPASGTCEKSSHLVVHLVSFALKDKRIKVAGSRGVCHLSPTRRRGWCMTINTRDMGGKYAVSTGFAVFQRGAFRQWKGALVKAPVACVTRTTATACKVCHPALGRCHGNSLMSHQLSQRLIKTTLTLDPVGKSGTGVGR